MGEGVKLGELRKNFKHRREFMPADPGRIDKDRKEKRPCPEKTLKWGGWQ